MSYWTSAHFEREGPTCIDPFDADRVVNCAYELRLGPEGYVTSDAGKKTKLEEGDQLKIPPGQFALLLTEERVTVPNNAIGFISIRSRFKIHGLVNVSGFHVDPGFNGQLVFSVYNAGGTDVIVSRGESLFLLWFASLEEETEDTYNAETGSRQDQETIPNSDIMAIGREHYSPAKVNDRLTAMEVRVEVILNIARALVVGLVLALATWGLSLISNGEGTQDVPSPTPFVSPDVVNSRAPQGEKAGDAAANWFTP